MQPLRIWRLARGWTQEELAERAGVNPVTVWRLERGARGRVTTWRAIAHALGVALDEIAEYRAHFLISRGVSFVAARTRSRSSR
jgi:transcriptional regulator with XRE-family HTH domain